MSVPVRERGYAHNPSPWWAIGDPDEETPELRWPGSIQVYDRMRKQDAQVRSVLRAVMLPITRTNWRIDPNGARPEVALHVANDLNLPLQGVELPRQPRLANRFSWSEHLYHALLSLVYGHSFFEQVYRYDDTDQLLHLRKLGWRPPRTIQEVEVAPDGGLVAIKQPAPLLGKKDVVLPQRRLVAYVNDREGGNWLGASLLRPAYKFWMLKDRALRVGQQTLERNGLGVPLYKASQQPDSLRGEERTQREQDEIAAGTSLAQAWRAGDDSGAAIPYGADLVLRGVEGTLPEAEPIIRYYDEQIARAVLAHFLNLGTETGSWALGSTFSDFFILSLQTIASHIADVATAHVIEDLVDENWGPAEPAPRIVFDEIGSRHPATAEAVRALVISGVITADEPLERALRTTYGLPAPDPDTRRELPGQAAPATTPDPEDATPPREKEAAA